MDDTRIQVSEDHFEIRDIVLEETDTSQLKSDEKKARPEGTAGTIVFKRASISGHFNAISYGIYEPRQCLACETYIDFNIRSTETCRIQEAKIICTIHGSDGPTSDIDPDEKKYPNFIAQLPKQLLDPHPTEVNKFKSLVLDPKINLAVYGGIEGMRSEWHESWTIDSRWTFKSERFSISDERDDDTVRYIATANEKDQDGFDKEIRIALQMEHVGKPFYIDFDISAKVEYPGSIAGGFIRRVMGEQRKIRARRHFNPPSA